MALNETEVIADFVGVGNEPIEGVLVELELERPIRDGQFGEMYLPERRRAVSDELGQIRDFHVVSNEDEDAYPENIGYTLTITYPDGTRTRKRVSVPDLASVSVFDLLNIEPGEPGDGNVGPAGPQGPTGDTGPEGPQGDSLEYDWDGTQLGVRAEDEPEFDYTDLEGPEGPKGDKGPQGPQGPQGDSLEYDWDGTQLGVRVEGDPSYQYTDLEGPQGPKGDKGDTGDFENVWQGAWDSNTTYSANDVVEHDGSSYISLVNSNTDEPPSSNWDTVAAKGADGSGGVPDGGTAGEYLRKASDTDQDVAWQAADAPTQAEFDDHSARHQSGGADVINVGGLSGELADPQPPKSHGNEAHDATFATEQYVDTAVDNATGDLSSVHAVNAEQNVRLWQLEADLLNATERFAGWQGDAFLVGQDEVASNSGLLVSRDADLNVGFAGLRADGEPGGVPEDWTDQTTPTSENLQSVAFDGSQWVVVGTVGTVITSPDGESWTEQTTPTSENLKSVAFDDTQWVAVGNSGTVITSPDGTSWTDQTSGTTEHLYGVAFDDTQWVAVGDSGTVITSPDGESWTEQTTPTSEILRGVATNGSLWVAVGDSGTVLTSPDGETWIDQSTPNTYHLYGVAYHDGTQWVAAGNNGTVITSPDGESWTEQTTPTTSQLRDVVHDGAGQWVAVGDSGTVITSPDGESWTEQTSGTTITLYGVAHADGLWVVVGNLGTVITSVASGSDDVGTVTLNTVTLPQPCDTVYLLADKTVDADVTETYEASLDGGTTWEPVVEGEATTLGHTGDQFALRFTHERPVDGTEESSVWWIVGYGYTA